jgi:hypothetical protein
MTAEQFETTIVRFLHEKPFRPFVVEMLDGRLIWINRPGLALNAGGATLWTPDDEIVEFTCDEVRDIRQAVYGAAS